MQHAGLDTTWRLGLGDARPQPIAPFRMAPPCMSTNLGSPSSLSTRLTWNEQELQTPLAGTPSQSRTTANARHRKTAMMHVGPVRQQRMPTDDGHPTHLTQSLWSRRNAAMPQTPFPKNVLWWVRTGPGNTVPSTVQTCPSQHRNVASVSRSQQDIRPPSSRNPFATCVLARDWFGHPSINPWPVFGPPRWARTFPAVFPTEDRLPMAPPGAAAIPSGNGTHRQRRLHCGPAEAELNGLREGASTSAGLVSMARDLSFAWLLRLPVDASAVSGTCSRRGLGTIRHLAAVDRGMQGRTRSNGFKLAQEPGGATHGRHPKEVCGQESIAHAHWSPWPQTEHGRANPTHTIDHSARAFHRGSPCGAS